MIEKSEVNMNLLKSLNYFSINRLNQTEVFEITEHMVLLCGILKPEVKDEIINEIDKQIKSYNKGMADMSKEVELKSTDIINQQNTYNQQSYRMI